MTVQIHSTAPPPEWLADVLEIDPEADVWVSFKAQPELFSRLQKVADHGVEYAGSHGMACAQPVEDIVAFRIGPAGEVVEIVGVTVELVGEELGTAPPLEGEHDKDKRNSLNPLAPPREGDDDKDKRES